MQTAWKVTEADRDDKGSIKVGSDEPRSLADLLPKSEPIKQDTTRQAWTRAEVATLASVTAIDYDGDLAHHQAEMVLLALEANR